MMMNASERMDEGKLKEKSNEYTQARYMESVDVLSIVQGTQEPAYGQRRIVL